ncbi:Atg14 domain-containing protein [Telluribacter sp. SYSU D00476]|uniref:Atg14 domain-containing protein n=1 Tax=Telluribacter sp. SYSU D00476 TaxID=2811430 RepID=UPI001FF3A9D3|nr:Atg14 domain-containing protein [Telluribacter sp. SYSU D00476]
MSFLKQLLNPFIEFEEDKNKQAPKRSTPPQAPSAQQEDENTTHPLINEGQAAAPPTPSTPAQQQVPQQADSMPFAEHVAYFDNLIDKANRENPAFHGPDFKEFVDTKLDIDDIADENLKYTTAFNILKNAGLSKEHLISTAQEYLNVIGRDLNAFQSAHARQYKADLQPKEHELQKKVEELQVLTQRLADLKKEINQMSQEISSRRDSLNMNRSSFLLAGEHKQKEIQQELEKITRYFGA